MQSRCDLLSLSSLLHPVHFLSFYLYSEGILGICIRHCALICWLQVHVHIKDKDS